MKPVFWLLLGLLSAIPVHAQAAPVTVTAETLQTHQRYLASRLQQGQFAAIDSLLATLSREQREFLLLQLLRDIPAAEPASPALQQWVESTDRDQASRSPEADVCYRLDQQALLGTFNLISGFCLRSYP